MIASRHSIIRNTTLFKNTYFVWRDCSGAPLLELERPTPSHRGVPPPAREKRPTDTTTLTGHCAKCNIITIRSLEIKLRYAPGSPRPGKTVNINMDITQISDSSWNKAVPLLRRGYTSTSLPLNTTIQRMHQNLNIRPPNTKHIALHC